MIFRNDVFKTYNFFFFASPEQSWMLIMTCDYKHLNEFKECNLQCLGNECRRRKEDPFTREAKWPGTNPIGDINQHEKFESRKQQQSSVQFISTQTNINANVKCNHVRT